MKIPGSPTEEWPAIPFCCPTGTLFQRKDSLGKAAFPSDHARRERKNHTHTHTSERNRKSSTKNLNFAKWQQSKRDTKRCMLRRTTKLTSDVETFCQPLQWPRVPLSQVPCLCADSTICFATDLSGLGKLANPLLSRRASFAIKKAFGIRFERALIA